VAVQIEVGGRLAAAIGLSRDHGRGCVGVCRCGGADFVRVAMFLCVEAVESGRVE
jgi:predicted TIM-barrel enzyme